MRKMDEYLSTIDTIYPDGYARETLFRDCGDMLEPAATPKPPVGFLMRMFNGIVSWREKRAGRMALRELTDDQLRDIGVTPEEARREIGKSFFWDSISR